MSGNYSRDRKIPWHQSDCRIGRPEDVLSRACSLLTSTSRILLFVTTRGPVRCGETAQIKISSPSSVFVTLEMRNTHVFRSTRRREDVPGDKVESAKDLRRDETDNNSGEIPNPKNRVIWLSQTHVPMDTRARREYLRFCFGTIEYNVDEQKTHAGVSARIVRRHYEKKFARLSRF